MLYVYGTHVFTKFMGYFGQVEECAQCHKQYKKSMVRIKKWAHLDYIPIFPCGTSYFYACPVCGAGKQLKKADARAIMDAPSDPRQQNLQVYAKCVIADPTKNKKSYELWVRDLITGEDVCVRNNLTKAFIKQEKKNRGLKELSIVDGGTVVSM